MGSTASMSSSKTIESWTLAAVMITESGIPFRSETTWRFVPFFPLSVGFAPVFEPPFGRDGSRI
jgi:fructose-specific phosphotransferase system IIC component